MIRRRAVISFVVIAIAAVIAIVDLVYLSTDVGLGPQIPNCGFTNLPESGGAVNLYYDVVSWASVKCDCVIEKAEDVFVNGDRVREISEYEFPLVTSDGQEGTEIFVAMSHPLTAGGVWNDGKNYEIKADITCSNGRKKKVESSFTASYNKDFGFFPNEEVEEVIENLANEGSGSGRFSNEINGGETEEAGIGNACSIPIIFVTLYFDANGYGPDIGDISASEKATTYEATYGGPAGEKLSNAIRAPNAAFGGAVFDTIGILPQGVGLPPVLPGFNNKGLAPLFKQNGDYFGIAGLDPRYEELDGNDEALVDSYRGFLWSIKEHKINQVEFKDKLVVIAFDDLIVRDTLDDPGLAWNPDYYDEEYNKNDVVNTRGVYYPDLGVVVLDLNPAEHFRNFEYQGPEIWDETVGEIVEAYAHEVGHALKLDHYDTDDNFMNEHGSGDDFTYETSCMARRQCHNLELQIINGYYAIHHPSGDPDTCGSKFLGKKDFLDEVCEKTFVGLYDEFPVNCDGNNPGVNYQFDGEWGASGRNTNLWCYSKLPADYSSTNEDNPKYDPIHPEANECLLIEFCGDGYFKPLSVIEECDPSVDGAGDSLCEEEFGENFKCGDPSKKKYCICVEEEPEKHGECVGSEDTGYACILMEGEEINPCSDAEECYEDTYSVCIDYQCMIMDGKGPNECPNGNSDCQEGWRSFCSGEECIFEEVEGGGDFQCFPGTCMERPPEIDDNGGGNPCEGAANEDETCPQSFVLCCDEDTEEYDCYFDDPNLPDDLPEFCMDP